MFEDLCPILKFIVIGDPGVGKSSLLCRFSKIRTIKFNNTMIKLKLWDTAGQERFESICKSYYRGANGIFIVYDLTNEISFSNLVRWYDLICQNADCKTPIVLIGNKCDLPNSRAVTYSSGQKLAQELGVSFFETSAKDNCNVDDAFMELTAHCIDQGLVPMADDTSDEKALPVEQVNTLSLTNAINLGQSLKSDDGLLTSFQCC